MATQSDLKNQLATVAGQSSVEKKPKNVLELIESMQDKFKKALPEHIGVDRFVRVAMTIVRTNPKLLNCDATSLVMALLQSAQLGLEPNTPLKEAHLIPYSNRRLIDGKWVSVNEAQFQMGYRGIIKLVWQSGLVSEIDCDTICQNDTVVYEKGKDATFKHIPNLKEDRGEPYAYYAYAVTKDGGFVCTVMSKNAILAHALRFSKSKKDGKLDGPWKDDFDSMALKTVLIALCDKKLPKSTEYQNLNQQIAQDSTIKRDYAEDMTEVVDVTDYSVTNITDDEESEDSGSQNKTGVGA